MQLSTQVVRPYVHGSAPFEVWVKMATFDKVSANPLFGEHDEYPREGSRSAWSNASRTPEPHHARKRPEPPSFPPPHKDDHSIHEAFDRARIEAAKRREVGRKLGLDAESRKSPGRTPIISSEKRSRPRSLINGVRALGVNFRKQEKQ